MYTSLGDAEAALEKAEEQVRKDGEEGGGDGAGEDHGVADHGDAAEDESAETSGADGGRDRGDADGDHRSGADAGENYRERQREADTPENLRVGHAHGFGGFEDGGIDSGEADIGVAQDGKKRVKHQSDDGGAAADSANEGNGNQETEESEARNRLQDAGNAEGKPAQSRTVHHEHAERDANENGKGHGDYDEREMLDCGVKNFSVMLDKEGPSVHVEAPGRVGGDVAKGGAKPRNPGWANGKKFGGPPQGIFCIYQTQGQAVAPSFSPSPPPPPRAPTIP